MEIKGWESGCYADACHGWSHVRARLAFLVYVFPEECRARSQARKAELASLARELGCAPSDDGREEDDALDALNEAAERIGDERRWFFGEDGQGLMFGYDVCQVDNCDRPTYSYDEPLCARCEAERMSDEHSSRGDWEGEEQ